MVSSQFISFSESTLSRDMAFPIRDDNSVMRLADRSANNHCHDISGLDAGRYESNSPLPARERTQSTIEAEERSSRAKRPLAVPQMAVEISLQPSTLRNRSTLM